MALSKRDKEILDELLGKGGSKSLLNQIYTVFLNLKGFYHLLEEFHAILLDPQKKEKAWDYLYAELRRSSKDVECSFIKDYPVTDFIDNFQEAFVAFSNEVRNRKYKGKANLNTYFHVILKHQILNFKRKDNKPGKYNSDDPAALLNNVANINEKDIHVILSTQARETMRRVAAAIGDDCVKRLDLFHIEGLRHQQVEEILNTGQATDPRRLANDCAHSFRAFFCEHPHLLEYLGRMEKLQGFIKRRKQILNDLKDNLGEECSQQLQLHHVCSVGDGRIEYLLKTALDLNQASRVGADNEYAANNCHQKTLGFFTARTSDLRYFGLRLEENKVISIANRVN